MQAATLAVVESDRQEAEGRQEVGADGAGGGGQNATRDLQGLLLMKIIHECHTEDRKHAELEMCDIGGGTTGHDTEPLPLYALPVLFHAIHHEESE